MAVLQEYKCPCCGGAIGFNSASQNMKCPFCDTEFELESLRAYDDALHTDQPDQMIWESVAENEWESGETDGLRSYVCRSCGGEIVSDATTAATACPYCGNPVVIMEQFAGMLKPDLVIPFKLEKKAAKESLLAHYKGKKLLPRSFKDENHIDEVKGVYVPVWLFDTDTDASVRFRATKLRHWTSGSYDYTETSYYAVLRSGSIGFEAVPVDGSEKMPDEIMESIEPYDLSQAVDFQTAYLAGYFADKYDVDAEQSIPRANERVKASAEQALASTVHGYATMSVESAHVQFENGKVRYALYPVWLLNTTWNGNQYKFAMNGQTGKLAGDLPVDKGLARKYFIAAAAVATVAATAVQALLWLL
ncbi:MAG: hypothetical protein Q3985_06115 [Eubacteriales bacterium]|nr:hypothetical protein [Eubacteriales bacterium]